MGIYPSIPLPSSAFPPPNNPSGRQIRPLPEASLKIPYDIQCIGRRVLCVLTKVDTYGEVNSFAPCSTPSDALEREKKGEVELGLILRTNYLSLG